MNPLAGLGKHELSEIINRYYGNDSVERILADFNIDIPINQLIRALPPVLADTKCDKCDVNYIAIRPARNNRDELVFYCPMCNHYPVLDDFSHIKADQEIPDGYGLETLTTREKIELAALIVNGDTQITLTNKNLLPVSLENYTKTCSRLEAKKILDKNNETGYYEVKLSEAQKNKVIDMSEISETVLNRVYRQWIEIELQDYFYAQVAYVFGPVDYYLRKPEMQKLKDILNKVSPEEARYLFYIYIRKNFTWFENNAEVKEYQALNGVLTLSICHIEESKTIKEFGYTKRFNETPVISFIKALKKIAVGINEG